MSTRSLEIREILNKSVTKDMRELMSQIVAIEPYTYMSSELLEKYNKLGLLVAINDYLEEYVVGNEDTTDEKLIQLIKLLPNQRLARQPELFNPADNSQPTTAYFDVKVDGVTYAGSTTAGYHDVQITFNGQCDVVKAVYQNKIIGAPGNSLLISNINITDGEDIEFRAYADGNILIRTSKLSFVVA